MRGPGAAGPQQRSVLGPTHVVNRNDFRRTHIGYKAFNCTYLGLWSWTTATGLVSRAHLDARAPQGVVDGTAAETEVAGDLSN
jgi:hypothetical protein